MIIHQLFHDSGLVTESDAESRHQAAVPVTGAFLKRRLPGEFTDFGIPNGAKDATGRFRKMSKL